jgi:hypothetical protein
MSCRSAISSTQKRHERHFPCECNKTISPRGADDWLNLVLRRFTAVLPIIGYTSGTLLGTKAAAKDEK